MAVWGMLSLLIVCEVDDEVHKIYFKVKKVKNFLSSSQNENLP